MAATVGAFVEDTVKGRRPPPVGGAACVKPVPVARIKGVQFGMLSSDAIRALSAVQVHESRHTGVMTHLAPPYSVMDAHMGSPDPRKYPCATCGRTVGCHGHLGSIQLAFPIYHISYFGNVLTLLRVCCYFCCRMFWPKSDDRLQRIDVMYPAGKEHCRRQRYNMFAKRISRSKKSLRCCVHCGMPQPVYREVKSTLSLSAHFKVTDFEYVRQFFEEKLEEPVDPVVLQEMKEPFNSARARYILKGIPHEDLAYIGLSPGVESYVPDVIPVLPIPMRPSNLSRNGSRAAEHHDLTNKYAVISRKTDALFDAIEGTSKRKTNLQKKSAGAMAVHAEQDAARHAYGPEDMNRILMGGAETLMQDHVAIQDAYAHLVENNSKGPHETQHSGKPINSIREIMMGKGGMLRRYIESKRVNFSGRGTIGGSPDIKVYEAGIPKSIALEVTIPKRVTKWNIQQLTECVRIGPHTLGGASHIETADGNEWSLKHQFPTEEERTEIKLREGWVVHRHLQDGDDVVLNRAPTLHGPGEMGHKAVLVDGETILMNLSVTTPYGADFDGDEVTLHFPQTPEAIVETRTTQSVIRHTLNATSNSTTMGAVQDTITGMRMLTSKNTFLERDEVMRLMCSSDRSTFEMPHPAILWRDKKTGRRKCLFTGKQMASACMSGTQASYTYCNDKSMSEDEALMEDETTVVRGGELLAGTLNKKALGPNKNLSIVHVVALFVGCKVALDMLFYMQRVVHAWMMWQGFSIRLQDVTVDEDTEAKIALDIRACGIACDNVRRKGLELDIDSEEIENAVNGIIQACNENVTKRVTSEATAKGSTTMTMISSGAKGTTANIKQMGGSVGQQKSEGSRLHLPGGERYLSCFPHGYEGIEARGAIAPSYMSGLNAYEMYYASKVALASVVKKTTATSITGFFERRMIKMMEDFIARTRCVMGATGRIIQMRFGGDGCDSRRLVKVTIKGVVSWGRAKVESLCRHHPALVDAFVRWQSVARRVYVGNIFPNMPVHALLPFSAPHLYNMRVGYAAETSEIAESRDILEACQTLYNSIVHHVGDTAASMACLHTCQFILEFGRREKRVGMSVPALQRLVSEATRMVLCALIESGECVGIVAGQCVSSECTQLMLDAPHVGGADKTVTQQGVPRLNEIVNGSTTRTPIMRVALHAQPTTRQLSSLITIRLGDLTNRRRTYVIEDPIAPDGATTRKARDLDFMSMNARFFESEAGVAQRMVEGDTWVNHLHEQEADKSSSKNRSGRSKSDEDGEEEEASPPPQPSRFVLRIELDRAQCERYAMKPRMIERVVSRHTGVKYCTLQSSDTLSDVWMVRIRPWFTPDNEDVVSKRVFLENLKDSLLASVSIGGVGDISSAKMATRERVIERPDGSLEQVDEPIVVTEGSCLASMARYGKWVDWRRTMTNDIVQVRETLGIWAARSVMLQQMHEVLFAQDGYVDPRHIQMLIDSQFRTGTFSKLNGSAISTADTGPFQRCLFEKQFPVLMEAGALGFEDKMDGVTQPMILGEDPPAGTGAIGLIVPYTHGMKKPRKAASAFGHLLMQRDKEDIVRESTGLGRAKGVDAEGYYTTAGHARAKPVPLPEAAFDPIVQSNMEVDSGATIGGDSDSGATVATAVAGEGEEGIGGDLMGFHPSTP